MADPAAPPVFLVGASPGGERELAAALGLAPGAFGVDADGSFLDDVARRRRLVADDGALLAGAARAALAARLVPGDGPRPASDEEGVAVVADGRVAEAVPFLAAVWPAARFVLVVRDPDEAGTGPAGRTTGTVADADAGGANGGAGAADPHVGRDAERWAAVTARLLDDLDALPPERWAVVRRARLLAEPRRELRRLCGVIGLAYDQALLGPLEEAARAAAASDGGTTAPSTEASPLPPAAAAVAARLEDLVPSGPRRASAPTAPFASRSTASFAARLEALGCSLLVTTYQADRVVCVRAHDGELNTHLRTFDRPMGVAADGERVALGTRTEVWELRDLSEAAAGLAPPDRHDACFLPRRRHVTGDVAVHDLALAGEETWLVATAFSCLATLDARHSFVPRWRPPFVTEVAHGDRCHLNGLAMVDGAPRFVTALGRSDEPGGWRAGAADGGVVVDVPTGEVVAAGLSMPHSPRWHGGRLLVLESGRGTLVAVDLATGARETIVELPGFTRGLAVHGSTAWVGLSQVRESRTFGDLPLTRRDEERVCGVWAVDLARGVVEGFLRFDDAVQELFDVAVLPGRRWPELAEADSSLVARSFVVP